MGNVRQQRLEIGLFLCDRVPVFLHDVVEPFQAVADPRQQRFRFIVHFRPCGAVHHVVQRPAQAVGEQGQFLLKVVQEDPAPYQKHSGQQPAVQNHPQVFRNQKQTQQHQERGGQQTNCNEPQKLFDR